MASKPLQRVLLLILILAAILLPVAICLLIGLGRLLGAMGDSVGGVILDRVALGVAVLWVLDLIWLLLALAIERLCGPDEPPEG
jgi:hypothetical protein